MTKARDLANVISGSGVLAGGVIPDLPASKITSGTIASARLSLSSSDIPNLDTAKITSGTLSADRVPNLATSKITSGTFDDARLSSSSVTQHVDLSNLSASNLTSGTVPNARITLDAAEIPDIPASKITSGTLGDARIPNLATSKITSGTFADARLASSNVTQHVDLSNLSASNLTSGTVPNARYGTPTFSAANLTSVPAATATTGSWTLALTGTNPSTCGAISNVTGKYQKIGQMVHCQCEFYVTTRPSQYGSYRLARWYLTGLPFTSYNFGQDWFAQGNANQSGMDRSQFMYFAIPSNDTILQPMLNGHSRMMTHWDVPDSGLAYRQHDGGEWLKQNNQWIYFSFTYMAAS